MPQKPRISASDVQNRLRTVLAAGGAASAVQLTKVLGISQPVFSRVVKALEREILVVGQARNTQYALRLPIEGVGATVPVYEVLPSGESRHLATLHGIAPRGFWCEWHVELLTNTFFSDLPYFLHDMRPSGFLGRLVPAQHPDLDLPSDVRLWSATHCIRYFARHGWDLSGNLIVGEAAFQLYMQQRNDSPLTARARAVAYAKRAKNIVSAARAGSSAGGEQPKFLATRLPGPKHVLVKFSPPAVDAVSRRMADLLTCEYVAARVLERRGISSAQSQLVHHQNQTFLEVVRFDRLPEGGRQGVISLAALDLEFVGSTMNSWSVTAQELAYQKHISNSTLAQIQWLEMFGRLIANTDMHLGNLSFFTRGMRIEQLAPIYDMLPMHYAPVQGHVEHEPTFKPPLPNPSNASLWRDACAAAVEFWMEVASSVKVSASFRKIARAHATELRL